MHRVAFKDVRLRNFIHLKVTKIILIVNITNNNTNNIKYELASLEGKENK